MVKLVTSFPEVDHDVNFFDTGMNLLQVLHLTRVNRVSLKKADFKTIPIAPSLIYTNPTVSKLTSAVMSSKDTTRVVDNISEKTRV